MLSAAIPPGIGNCSSSNSNSFKYNFTVAGNTLFFTVNGGSASFSIAGIPAVGQRLTAWITANDPDGHSTGGFSHSWQASVNGITWSTIATGHARIVAKAQEGQQIRLLTTYTDGQSFRESLVSSSVLIPFVNDGKASFSIAGIPAVGQRLTATIMANDPDGNGTGAFSHSWQASANGITWITIATGAALTVAKTLEGQQIRLITTYTDDQGFRESVSAPAVSIPFVNDGKASFSITGTPAVGQRLTATITANDPDGDGVSTFSHTWQASANGSTWSAIATGSSLTIVKAQEGQQIRLLTTYTDDQGFNESLISTPTAIP